MHNDQLVYKVVILAFFGISLWKEKVALITCHWLYKITLRNFTGHLLSISAFKLHMIYDLLIAIQKLRSVFLLCYKNVVN